MNFGDEAAVDLLEEMLRIPSLTGDEENVASLLLALMERAGFEAYRDDAGNAVGTASAGERSVVILGHMDTVPGVVPVERRDGMLYGRGAVDAKGPLATGLVAAIRAAGSARLRVTVIGAVQEEGPSVGARHLVHRHPPDYLIIAEPSGWDAIVMGYKGSQRFTVQISGPLAHSAGPGSTAPERAVQFWNDLVVWCATRSPVESSAEFERLTPTLIGMDSWTDGLIDSASLHIGLRLPPGMAPDDVRAAVQTMAPEAAFEFQPAEPAVRGGKNNPLVSLFLRSIRAEEGKPRFKVKTGTSDMNVVGPVWGCPMLAYGPGDSRLDHTPEEHVPIDEYLRAIRVLTRVLQEL